MLEAIDKLLVESWPIGQPLQPWLKVRQTLFATDYSAVIITSGLVLLAIVSILRSLTTTSKNRSPVIVHQVLLVSNVFVALATFAVASPLTASWDCGMETALQQWTATGARALLSLVIAVKV